MANNVVSVENIVWQLKEDSHGLRTFPKGSFWDTAKYFGGVTHRQAWEAGNHHRVEGFFFKENRSLFYWNILATIFGKGGLTSDKDSKWKRLRLLVPKEFDVDWRKDKQGEQKLKRLVPAWGRPDDPNSTLPQSQNREGTYDEFDGDEARELIEQWKFDIASQQYFPTDAHRAKLKGRIMGARDNEIPVEDRAEAYRLGVRDLRRIVLLEHVIITGFTDDDDEFGQGANCCTPPADTGKREHKYNLTKQKQADNERLVVLPPFFTYRQWFACYCARDPAWSLL